MVLSLSQLRTFERFLEHYSGDNLRIKPPKGLKYLARIPFKFLPLFEYTEFITVIGIIAL